MAWPIRVYGTEEGGEGSVGAARKRKVGETQLKESREGWTVNIHPVYTRSSACFCGVGVASSQAGDGGCAEWVGWYISNHALRLSAVYKEVGGQLWSSQPTAGQGKLLVTIVLLLNAVCAGIGCITSQIGLWPCT